MPSVAPLAGFNVRIIQGAFQQFGSIEKIVMGPDQAPLPLVQVDVLLQFADAGAAARAAQTLQGVSLTSNAFHRMGLELANLSELVVTACGELSWDFTRQAASPQVHGPHANGDVRGAENGHSCATGATAAGASAAGPALPVADGKAALATAALGGAPDGYR